MPSLIDMKGKRIGRLTVLKRVEDRFSPKGRPFVHWLCECDCGETCEVRGTNLRSGHTTSCGCAHRSKARALLKGNRRGYRHGHTQGKNQSPTWKSWRAMIKRCIYPRHVSYPYYGGRGVKVCNRWLNSFESFLEDKPSNCRWATASEQRYNRRENV